MEDVLTSSAVYTKHNLWTDICYTAENALREGSKMAMLVDQCIKRLDLGSKMREDVWTQELESLKSQGAPSTMIAVCGATGAGKSSVLNAILDNNIVPTSGMRACTAAVTEIAYHASPTIEAEISFLSEAEWRAELEVLLLDLVNDNGKVKRVNSLKGDAIAAWSKVNAVYPGINLEQLGSMTVDQVVAHDPSIRQRLGTVLKVSADESGGFIMQIEQYIGSKSTQCTYDEGLSDREIPAGPTLWPLVRLVNIRCASQALQSGVVLVDLPGVADVNAARNSIAQEYMRKCNRIWIVAPITRAVDDKTAKDLLGDAFRTQLMMDGNYDAHTITFIASKCDDVSCSEVLRTFRLHDDPVLKGIVNRIEECNDKIQDLRSQQRQTSRDLELAQTALSDAQEAKAGYEACFQKQRAAESMASTRTAKARNAKVNAKRKASGSRRASSKRGKGSASTPISLSSGEDGVKFHDSSEEEENDPIETLSKRITEQDLAIRTLHAQINGLESCLRRLNDAIAFQSKEALRAQRDKNAFCSTKRSEFSCGTLKEDFRLGLREFDEAAAEKDDPDNFDPDTDLRDYASIDLPVFPCSSRDYIRLRGQDKVDGEPSCFSDVEDTGIPALQRWCHHLGISSRERAARSLLENLRVFVSSVQQFTSYSSEIAEQDRAMLRRRWSSTKYFSKLESKRPLGISLRLESEFGEIIKSAVNKLKAGFESDLQEKCAKGAALAVDASLETLDEFAASMHWGTYRATLRRHGSYCKDLNVALIVPMTKSIASSWASTFEADLFADFHTDVMTSIYKLTKDVEESTTAVLFDRIKGQADICVEEARQALESAISVVQRKLNTQQKIISRCLGPHVRQQMIEGYSSALKLSGPGSVARQKTALRDYVANKREEIFQGCVNSMMEQLSDAATSVGEALDGHLNDLAKKVEISIAVLWESVPSEYDPTQRQIRDDIANVAADVVHQIGLWETARESPSSEATKEVVREAVKEERVGE